MKFYYNVWNLGAELSLEVYSFDSAKKIVSEGPQNPS